MSEKSPCLHERLDADGVCQCGWSAVTRESGDGEPSSAPPAARHRTFISVRNHREAELSDQLKELLVIKQVNAFCFKVWFGGVFTGVEGSEEAAKNKGNVMINSILRKLRSGAAQEVSPPSPDPKKELKCQQ